MGSVSILWDPLIIFISICVSLLGNVTSLLLLKHRAYFMKLKKDASLSYTSRHLRCSSSARVHPSSAATHPPSATFQIILLFICSCTFGTVSVFSMHFVGMLSLSLRYMGNDLNISYDVLRTVMSCLLSICAAFMAFLFASNSFHYLCPCLHLLDFVLSPWYGALTLRNRKALSYVSGSIFGSLAIVSMHYVGMSAISGPFEMSYRWELIFAACLIAFVSVCAALLILSEWEKYWIQHSMYTVVVAVILTVAVCAMHYTGMQGIIYSYNGQDFDGYEQGMSKRTILAIVLVLSVGSCAGCIAFVIRQISQRQRMNLILSASESASLHRRLRTRDRLMTLLRHLRLLANLENGVHMTKELLPILLDWDHDLLEKANAPSTSRQLFMSRLPSDPISTNESVGSVFIHGEEREKPGQSLESGNGRHAYARLKQKTSSSFQNTSLTLEDILDHPVCLELFKDVTISTHSSENVQFWLLVRKYKALFDSEDDATRDQHFLDTVEMGSLAPTADTSAIHNMPSMRGVDTALRPLQHERTLRTIICNNFIRENAPSQINISSSQREAILRRYPSLTSEPVKEMFDEAEKEVLGVMRTDMFTRFIHTKQYLICEIVYSVV
jgi:NO-binding membrane sensor protein with MHYT domain